MIVACVGAVVIHLPQFRLPRAGTSAMHHPLMVAPISLVLMVQRRGSLLG